MMFSTYWYAVTLFKFLNQKEFNVWRDLASPDRPTSRRVKGIVTTGHIISLTNDESWTIRPSYDSYMIDAKSIRPIDACPIEAK